MTRAIPIGVTGAAIVLGLLVAGCAVAPESPLENEQSQVAPHFEAPPAEIGAFIVALGRDQRGCLWVGTEEKGVWRYDPAAQPLQAWKQFTRAGTGGGALSDGPASTTQPAQARGLGDDWAYALCCDKLGRIWVGHLNHGVSVYCPESGAPGAGGTWRNYDILSGPLGERVFDIKTCPIDGDVWIATSAGLTRYSVDKDTWSYYTRADGLVSDQVQALAFDPRNGDVYLATQSDGLLKGRRGRGGAYGSWQHTMAPATADPLPIAPIGDGLPSDRLNDVLVARDGKVYVATPTGLAWSTDGGVSFHFLRGQDWLDKARGLYRPPSEDELASARAALSLGADLLREDYCTCLAEEASADTGAAGGVLWIGHRRQGCEAMDVGRLHRLPVGDAAAAALGKVDYVARILLVSAAGTAPGDSRATGDGRVPSSAPAPESSGAAFVAGYGAGLAQVSGGLAPLAVRRVRPALPTPARPPSLADLETMLTKLQAIAASAPDQQPTVVALPDDWRTQGAWLGRYGRYWITLCACCSPSDYRWGTGEDHVQYHAYIGPHHDQGDSIRYWVHWLYTDNNRSLEMVSTYLHSRVLRGETTWEVNRRQAEWCDNGQAYPMTKGGPDLYCDLSVPEGVFYLGLYDFNKDGHQGNNRLRDFRVSIKARAGSEPIGSVGASDDRSVPAHARICDFWGGVWKRFLVQGPCQLTIQVRRDYSLCAILAGVTLDRVEEYSAPYFDGPDGGAAGADAQRRFYAGGAGSAPAAEVRMVQAIWKLLIKLQADDPAWHYAESRRFYAPLARWYQNALTRSDAAAAPAWRWALAGCYYQLQSHAAWEQEQQRLGLVTARQIEQALRWDGNPNSHPGEDRDLVEAYRAAHAAPAGDPAK